MMQQMSLQTMETFQENLAEQTFESGSAWSRMEEKKIELVRSDVQVLSDEYTGANPDYIAGIPSR